MANRLTVARVGAAVLAASAALVLSSALPANADNGPSGNGPSADPSVTASPDPSGDPKETKGNVWLKGRGEEPTVLIALKAKDGTEILTYCVEININEGGRRTTMVQVPWTDYPDQNSAFNKNKDKINWILNNSYPMLDVAALSTAAGTPTTLSPQEAVEGTQAAIWNLSDGTNLDTNNQHNDANVKALYGYLLSTATALPQPTAAPTLSIDSPSSTKGETGGRIGPFTVDTNLQLLTLTSQLPAGVTIEATDAQGNAVALNKIVDGTKVWFVTPTGISAGDGSFTVSGDQQIGQLFVGSDVAAKASLPGGIKKNCKGATVQSLIVAKSTALAKTVTASWTVPVVTTTTTAPPSESTTPTGTETTTPTTSSTVVVAPTTTTAPPAVANTSSSLPFTGVNVLAPVGLAVVLIAAGGTFLVLQRRRRRA
jgi:TQXA domain-containing protein